MKKHDFLHPLPLSHTGPSGGRALLGSFGIGLGRSRDMKTKPARKSYESVNPQGLTFRQWWTTAGYDTEELRVQSLYVTLRLRWHAGEPAVKA